mmetsp:Transcript_44713/g.72575  ORF Transcript_44713/g.72575 Transcript_44713/m.72575 type:complete len:322 (+) Transcript_44713:1089-2054(+)
MQTGKTTLYWPFAGSLCTTSSVSAFAASPSMRHLKGISAPASAPKLTANVTFLQVSAGKRVLPLRQSGKGCGCETLTPSRNKLMVFAFADLSSRFRTTPSTDSRLNFCDALVAFPLWVKKPSESKQTLSSESPRKRDEAAVEKPIRTNCLGRGVRPLWAVSVGSKISTILASKKYRPAFKPQLARAPASKYCMPPSVSAMRTLPCTEGMTFKVMSAVANMISPASFARLSSTSSSSSSLRGSGAGGGGVTSIEEGAASASVGAASPSVAATVISTSAAGASVTSTGTVSAATSACSAMAALWAREALEALSVGERFDKNKN